MADRAGGGAAAKPALRRDAQRNLEKLTAAAVEVFQERGLDVPLEEIAQRAGVSTGTLYNRFGSREALIDAVMPDLASAQLAGVAELARAHDDPWEAFAFYIGRLCEFQATNPGFNDVVSRRFPDAEQLIAVCDGQMDNAREFIDRAHEDGSLRADFTAEDLSFVFWSTAMVLRATAATVPDAWRRALAFILDGLRAGAAHPLPVPPLTHEQVHEGMLRAG